MTGDEHYEYLRDPADAWHWAHARTLSDIGELTARWLEGSLNYQPAWEGARPDPETELLVPALVALNRGGFVTHFSQPGAESTEPARVELRATVSGFTTEAVIDRLQQRALGTDLIVLAYPPGGGLNGQQLVVGASDGRACRWAGAEMSARDIDEYYRQDLHADGVAALQQAWQATVIDPHWGRNDLLWEVARHAV